MPRSTQSSCLLGLFAVTDSQTPLVLCDLDSIDEGRAGIQQNVLRLVGLMFPSLRGVAGFTEEQRGAKCLLRHMSGVHDTHLTFT